MTTQALVGRWQMKIHGDPLPPLEPPETAWYWGDSLARALEVIALQERVIDVLRLECAEARGREEVMREVVAARMKHVEGAQRDHICPCGAAFTPNSGNQKFCTPCAVLRKRKCNMDAQRRRRAERLAARAAAAAVVLLVAVLTAACGVQAAPGRSFSSADISAQAAMDTAIRIDEEAPGDQAVCVQWGLPNAAGVRDYPWRCVTVDTMRALLFADAR